MKQKNIIKSINGQQLNQREVGLINGGATDGFLMFDVESKNDSVSLIYNTNNLISLLDFLQTNEMSRSLFVVLLRNIVIALKSIDNNKLSNNLVEWGVRTSYIDPVSWYVYHTYVPLQPYDANGNLKSYLSEIVSYCNFSGAEDLRYVQNFVEDLNAGVAYSCGKLEEFCDKISEQLILENSNLNKEIICLSCSSKLKPEDIFCPYCGTKVKDQSVNAERLSNTDSISIMSSANEEDNGVVTVFKASKNSARTIWLEDREKSGKIIITKYPFRIGKMEGITDHRIFNNAVSRKHADIIKEDDQYYIMDLDSTNGTYVNGKKIQPGVKELLSDGTVLKFADSEFKFHID